MKLTNDCYRITLRTKNGAEHYFRDDDGWVKVSTRGRTFRATAEQVLNHLLPVLAGLKPGMQAEVTYRYGSVSSSVSES
jgi:hypothetical protein